MGAGHGELLRLKIELTAPLLDASTARFWEHARLPALFPLFLQTLYGSARATSPLMQTACEALRRREGDPLAAPLQAYFGRHLVEEAAHDEWLLDDLASIGIPRERVLAPAPQAIARLVGAQYYWIAHAHPVCLLGFFAVLEGFPPTDEHLDDVQRRTGLPATAFRMLRHHASEDPAHADEVFRMVDELPLEPWQRDLVSTSALATVSALHDVFEWLLEQESETVNR
jgi:hypothetical protein